MLNWPDFKLIANVRFKPFVEAIHDLRVVIKDVAVFMVVVSVSPLDLI